MMVREISSPNRYSLWQGEPAKNTIRGRIARGHSGRIAITQRLWKEKIIRKNVLINYEKLRELAGAESYDLLKRYHQGWVEKYLGNENNIRDDKWTKGIAVGSKGFVEHVKSALGALAKGRKANESGDSYQLRETSALYGEHFGVKNEDMGLKNTYFWNFNPE